MVRPVLRQSRRFQDDEFTMRWGQNWGFPLYNWDRMEQDDFAWWKRRVKRLCEIFRAFRIDHALGFYRIYSFPWTPDRNGEFLPLTHDQAREITGGHLPGFKPGPDDSDENQARNRACGEKFLGAIGSAAADAGIVAEDLGMVPHYMPESMAVLGMAGIKVPMWSQEHDGEFVRGEHYPQLSMATYATHDHAPIKTQWDHDRRIIAEGDPADRVDDARYYLHRWARWAYYDDAIKDVPPMFGDFCSRSAPQSALRLAIMLRQCDDNLICWGSKIDSTRPENSATTIGRSGSACPFANCARIRIGLGSVRRVKNLLKDTGRLGEPG